MLALMQDWIELNGSGAGEVAQSGAAWLDLQGYDTVCFWLDVRLKEDIDPGYLHYDTAPAVDPTLFTSMASVELAVNSRPTVTQIVLAQNPTTPLAGLVRWRVKVDAGANWRLAFRIRWSAKGKSAVARP